MERLKLALGLNRLFTDSLSSSLWALVTVWILDFAVDGWIDAVGASIGTSAAMARCSSWPEEVLSRLAYSSPSWPIEGR